MIFFSRPPFNVLDKRHGAPYLKRISSIIRAEQIANYIGAKLNPEEYGDELSVHIKPIRMERVKDGDYVDVLDDPLITEKMKERPDVNILAMTSPHKEWLESFLPNKIVHIPHQHMNFERYVSKRQEVLTCGYIGAYTGGHEYICGRLEKALEAEGIKMKTLFTYPTREDIINFYQSIDIQVIPMFGHLTNTPYYHEKKIVDAMSFGIPTISEEKLGYRDVDSFYFKVKDMDELISKVKTLEWDSQRLIDKAEEYHISNIAKKYERLINTHTS